MTSEVKTLVPLVNCNYVNPYTMEIKLLCAVKCMLFNMNLHLYKIVCQKYENHNFEQVRSSSAISFLCHKQFESMIVLLIKIYYL